MTSAASAIFVLLDCPVFSAYVVTLAIKIIRVTGRAERLVLGPVIHKWNIDTVSVTAATPRVYSMVTRVIPLKIVTKDAWCPAVCRMTRITLYSRV